jgi:5'/3'-nucleotidase
MPTILVTNDDGVHSPGIRALAASVEHLGEVFLVAPTQEASAIGHALTLRHPLRLEEVGRRMYAVDGTPTDCVNIGVTTVIKGLPDLVLSGINKGWNLGDDITYSGTVAGALEGALLGVPAIAVSLRFTRGDFDFTYAARAAAEFAERVLLRGLPPRTFLNINVPRGAPRGVRVTVQAKRNHITSVSERCDPKGRSYYWIEEGQDEWQPHDRSDYQAVRDGYVSVTPLHPDLTAHAAMAAVEDLSSASAPDQNFAANPIAARQKSN